MRYGAPFCIALCAGQLCGEAPSDLRAIVRKSMERMTQSIAQRLDYTFTQRTEKRELADDGTFKTVHTFMIRREVEGKSAVYRQTEKDGKPIAPADQKVQRFTREQELKRIRTELDWMLELPDALDFRKAGEETVNGRLNIILDFWPHPGSQPKSLRSRVFEKSKGRLYIDKQESELTRGDAEVFDNISIGFGIGKIEKGTRFHIERARGPSGVWLLDRQDIRFAIRLMLIKDIQAEVANQYFDYRYKAEKQASLSIAP